MIMIYLNGELASRSKNLRGIIDRSRRVAVDWVNVLALDSGGGVFSICWADSSHASVFFNSLDLAHKFAKRYSK